jgi:transposase-like protein
VTRAIPVETRRLIYSTNGIDSLNGRFWQVSRRRGHFPSEQAAMKLGGDRGFR